LMGGVIWPMGPVSKTCLRGSIPPPSTKSLSIKCTSLPMGEPRFTATFPRASRTNSTTSSGGAEYWTPQGKVKFFVW